VRSAVCHAWQLVIDKKRERSRAGNKRGPRSKADNDRFLSEMLFPTKMREVVREGQSLFPYAMLLLPGVESVSRRKYGIKEKKFAE
jgi:hypothetical protein